MSAPNALSYAGDLSPSEVWKRLADDSATHLIDVRTQAEWVYVGIPDLAELERQPLFVSWQLFPTMVRNESFAAQLEGQGIKRGEALYFICRSGVRSKAAAELMTALGFGPCHNVADGFEGHLDDTRHRSGRGGWKAAGLPWIQG